MPELWDPAHQLKRPSRPTRLRAERTLSAPSMSEDKNDIQSQIDRLDLDWRGGLDDYKVKQSIGASVLPRMPSDIPSYSLRITVGVGLPSIGLVGLAPT